MQLGKADIIIYIGDMRTNTYMCMYGAPTNPDLASLHGTFSPVCMHIRT